MLLRDVASCHVVLFLDPRSSIRPLPSRMITCSSRSHFNAVSCDLVLDRDSRGRPWQTAGILWGHHLIFLGRCTLGTGHDDVDTAQVHCRAIHVERMPVPGGVPHVDPAGAAGRGHPNRSYRAGVPDGSKLGQKRWAPPVVHENAAGSPVAHSRLIPPSHCSRDAKPRTTSS